MIAAAWVVFLAAAAVLYWQWASTNEPNCVIVIDAAPPLKGARIVVDSDLLVHPLKATVGESDRYSLPFYVDPGRYTIKITMQGDVLYESEVVVAGAGRGWRVDLTKLRPPTTAPLPPATNETFP
jgi:hypothetical protein